MSEKAKKKKGQVAAVRKNSLKSLYKESAYSCAEMRINMDISINENRIKPKHKAKLSGSFILRMLVRLSAFITIGVMVGLVVYILVMGIPNLNGEFFSWEYTPDNCSVMPAIINTIIIVALTLIMAVPIGIGSAIYMVEYAKKGNRLVRLVRVTTETLAGIPSIVFGLFGYLCFNVQLGLKYSLLGGAMTLAIMVLPAIMRTTEESLLSVNDSYREGSFGLGAGKLRTVFKVVLPSAIPGILSGVILAIGRIVGETAVLIFTAGTMAVVPESGIFGAGRTIAVHMYQLFNEGRDMEAGYATGVVLIIMVIFINGLANLAGKRLVKGKEA